MGLIGNRNVAFRASVRHMGGGISPILGGVTVMNRRASLFSAAFTDRKVARPIGYLHPYAFDMPLKPGSMSTFNQVRGVGTLAAAMVGGKNAEAALSGSGSMSATGRLVVAAAVAMSGSGALAGLAVGVASGSVALSGSGTMSAALGALASGIAALSGTGSLSVEPYATGTMEANITNEAAGLSVTQIVEGVWSAVAASYNDTGSMGEKLNGAGSAGNPWTEVIETGMTAAQAMRLITAALAGELSGADTGTVTIRNAVADNADRITATVDGNGNRTAITYDLD
jgi:hypothetical protein